MGQRERRLLAVLGVVVVVLLGVRVGPALLGGGEPGPRTGRAPRAAVEPRLITDVVELEMAALEGESGEFRPGRDPWSFAEPPPPPGPTPEELERARVAEQEARRRLEEERAAEPERPRLPPVDVTYLGNFGPAHKRIAVFSDGQSIYNAQAGETVGGRFLVLRIGYESVDLGYVQHPEAPAQRLRVGG